MSEEAERILAKTQGGFSQETLQRLQKGTDRPNVPRSIHRPLSKEQITIVEQTNATPSASYQFYKKFSKQ